MCPSLNVCVRRPPASDSGTFSHCGWRVVFDLPKILKLEVARAESVSCTPSWFSFPLTEGVATDPEVAPGLPMPPGPFTGGSAALRRFARCVRELDPDEDASAFLALEARKARSLVTLLVHRSCSTVLRALFTRLSPINPAAQAADEAGRFIDVLMGERGRSVSSAPPAACANSDPCS